MAPYDGAHVQLQMKARILPERSLVFQFSGLLLSGSFNCDKKKVVYFEQEDSSLFTNCDKAHDLAQHGEFWSQYR